MTDTLPMTPAEVKKAMELEDLHFARLLRPDVLPTGEYEEDKDERPDIVVCGPGWRYGVEVTGMVAEEEKAQEGVRVDVCDRARSQAGSLPGIHVTVVFRREKFIGAGRERDRLAGLLTALVRAEVARRDRSSKWLVELKDVGAALTEWATSVFIHNLPGDTLATWRSQEYWGVGPLLPAVVRQRISAKEGKLVEYRLRAPRVVLLLVISGVSGAESSHVPPLTRQATYRTDFDSVVLLDRLNAEVIELDTCPLS